MTVVSVLTICGAVVGLYGLHLLLLWCESRGWIFYAKKRASPNALGNAFVELQQLAEPQKKYVMEVRELRHERREQDDQGSGK